MAVVPPPVLECATCGELPVWRATVDDRMFCDAHAPASSVALFGRIPSDDYPCTVCKEDVAAHDLSAPIDGRRRWVCPPLSGGAPSSVS